MALQWVDDDEGGHWEDDGYNEGGGYNLFAQESADYLNNQYAQPSDTQDTIDDNYSNEGRAYQDTSSLPNTSYTTGTDSSASGGLDLWGTVKSIFMKDGKPDWSAIKIAAAGVGGIAGLAQNILRSSGSASSEGGGDTKIGYQGTIPKYLATRVALPPVQTGGLGSLADSAQPANPYAIGDTMGKRYFTDVFYTPKAASTSAADTTTTDTTVAAAHGGLMGLAGGGSTGVPRYLAGGTDGMADELHASIDDKQPAKLSHGEFVIPADVVGHLGNGNSEAGAKRLYEMMARIRKARTGNPEQGKRINPNKFLPS